MNNWNKFLIEFTNNIVEIYKNHENTFDRYDIHSKTHISRSLIFAEFMSRFYIINKIYNNINFSHVRYAVSFHDSGREGNGVDLWENDSANLCKNYLLKIYSLNESEYISNLIIKKNINNNIEKQIVTDSDVIDIMRPCTGVGGILGFNENYLSFLKNDIEYSNIRKTFIIEAWELIKVTENNKFNYSNTIYDILNEIKSNKDKYKLLNKYL